MTVSRPATAGSSSAAIDHAREAAGAEQHRRRWWILMIVAVAQLMIVLDTTVVNIALPSAQKALGFSNGDRQWVVTAYALAFGSLLLLGGRLADLIGRKRMFLIGLAGFAVASAVGGASTSFIMLVAARAVQGGFGAMLAPAALSLLSTTFTSAEERGRAFAIYGAVAAGGSAVGLLLGGVLTEYLSWRWCMYVNLIFAAVALIGGLLLLQRRDDTTRAGIDLRGILLVITGLFSLVFGFSEAETSGWGAGLTLGFLIGGVLLLAAFIWSQARAVRPVLPLRVLLDRNRGGAYLAIFTVGAGMFGVFLFLTYYLQQDLGFSAVLTGLAFLPLTAAILLVSQGASALLTPRVGPRWIIAPGIALSGLGLLMLTQISLHSSYLGSVLPALIVFGAGMGLMFSSAMSVGTAGVRPEDAGVASAMVNIGQQVGGSIGTALLNTIAASALAGYLSSHAASPQIAQLAAIHGYVTAFWWAGGILLAGAVVTFCILRPEVAVTGEAAEPAVAL